MHARLLKLTTLVACLGFAGGSPPVVVEKFAVDEAHSGVEFTVRFMGLTRVRGRFADYSGTFMYVADDLTQSSARVVIEVASIDTDHDTRDKHLRSPDWFDAEQFPIITFTSDSITRGSGADEFLMHGPLSIKDVTRQVAIPFSRLHGKMADGWGNVRIGFEGHLTISRKEFDVVGGTFWNKSVDLTRLAVADEVEILLNMQASVPNLDRWNWNAREKPSVGETLMPIAVEHGGQAAVAEYRRLKSGSPDGYNFAAREMNLLGYRLLQHGHVEAATSVLEVLREERPEASFIYDSLGEAYALLGDLEMAQSYYRRALELDPDNAAATEMLRWLDRSDVAFAWATLDD